MPLHEVLVDMPSRLIELPDFVFGTIFGTILSALVSWWIQSRAFKKEECFRKAEFKLSQQALGRSLLIKLLNIHEDINNIHKHIEVAFQKMENHRGNIEPFGAVERKAFIPDPVRITTDELGMLMGLGDGHVFDLARNMQSVHENLMGNMKLYGSEREEILSELPDLKRRRRMVGNFDKSKSTPKQILDMESMNNMISEIREHAKRGTEESRQAVNDLNELLKTKLGLGLKFEFKK